MALIYIFWGAAIGLLVAAPVGPVNVICIRRTIAFGPSSGFIVGLGAAVADTIFGGVAAFGLSSVTALLVKTNGWFELIGGLIMLVIGFDVWRTHPHMSDAKETPRGLYQAAFTTFLLTISNPLTILGFCCGPVAWDI